MVRFVYNMFFVVFTFCTVIFPGEVAAQPDLNSVEYLSESDDYQVLVNAVEQFVYKSSKNGSHQTHGISSMSFINFDLAGSATIDVTPSVIVSSYEIRPYSENIASTFSSNTISFTLTEPKKLVIVVNGTYDPVLVVCANPAHTPTNPNDVEYYYEPGVHHIGYRMGLSSNDDVYLAEGAVVEGSFNVENANNVNITGRGIIACGEWPHQEDFSVIRGRNTADVLIEGITICNAPGWIISFWGDSNGLTVRNVKEIGNWLYNTDGVQTGTNRLLVEDCFLQCNDDNFSLNGTCTNVEIRDSVFWNIYNGGVFMLGWGIGYLSDINIHDNVIFRSGGCCSHHRKGPFCMKLENSDAVVQNVNFANIIVEEIVQWSQWVNFLMEAPGSVHNINFSNIDILNMTWGPEALLDGYSADYPIEDVNFSNVNINGQLIKGAKDGGMILNNTRNIYFLDSNCAGSLSAEWTSTQLGLGTEVCAREDVGVFTIEGGESYHFVHKDASGNIEIIARVVSLENPGPGARAGVMIRQSTDPNTRYAMVAILPDNRAEFVYLSEPNGIAMGGVGPTYDAKYVRLIRMGDWLYGYYSAGSAEGPWTQIAAKGEVIMNRNVPTGLCVTSANDLHTTAVFEEVSIQEDFGEVLLNPGYEDGLNHWSAYNDGKCDVKAVTTPVRSGAGAASVYNRTWQLTGIQQDVTDRLLQSGPGSYTYSAFVRTESGTLPIYAIVRIDDAQGTHFHAAPSVEADTVSWEQSEATTNLTWDGLISATFYAETNSMNTDSYFVDDCSLYSNHPVANDDDYGTGKDTLLNVDANLGVLANDIAYKGNLTAILVSGASHGSLTLNSDGSFQYDPRSTFTGTDSFTYKANDGEDDSNVATVYISVGIPVGWWKFDEGSGSNARNSGSFGSSYDGTLTNMDGNDWVEGRIGKGSLEFDGSDDYILVPALNLDSNTVTISAWIKRDGEQAESYTGIVFSSDGSTRAGITFGGTGPTGDPPWGINNELAYNWNNDMAAWDFRSGLIIPDNQWVFVAVVVEPTQATLYLFDGTTLSSATNVLNHDIEEFDGLTLIGHDVHSFARHFRGMIDDVRIYNRALSQAEIEKLANPNKADFDGDGEVDFTDYTGLGSAWRSGPGDGNWYRCYDISEPNDNIIDELDVMVFTDNWLEGL